MNGKYLNNKWDIGAKHALYRLDGRWYHILKRFPAALCDENGYVLFNTDEEYRSNQYLKIVDRTNHTHVPRGISSMPNYVHASSLLDNIKSEFIEQNIELSNGQRVVKRIEVFISRVIRDTKISKQIKKRYNYECQICGLSISTNTEAGKYVEAAHIKPIAKGGNDNPNNIICLCPNHHTMLDFGTISIDDDLTLLGMKGELKCNHKLDIENLKYHRDTVFKK